MTIGIHQPNYLPWPGYFYKIFASDVFVFHDIVAFSKSSYTKRCMIRAHKGSARTVWLSVPVQNHHSGTPISEIIITEKQDWPRKHLHKIKNTYSAAPYFDTVMPWLTEAILNARGQRYLAQVNQMLIIRIAERLSLQVSYRTTSELHPEGNGAPLNLRIVKQLGGTSYLAGTGSRKYQDDLVYEKAGILPLVHDFGGWLSANPYDQGTGEFTEGLSIVDPLMHLGTEGVTDLFRRFEESIY